MDCVKCGTELAADIAFCPVCGTPAERRVEEIKDVAVLFADLEGFTDFSEGLPPDELADLSGICMTALDASVARFGGTVDKYLGDGLMALFGAPVRREKDPEMAVRAGLDMFAGFGAVNDEIESRTGRRLGLRVGIATGAVRLGGVGSADDYTAMGEVVNLARKIEEGGETGSCLVDENTYQLTADSVEYEPWPGDLSGKIRAAKRVREVPQVLRRVELIDRTGEVTKLTEALEHVREGKSVSVSVVGAAGAGKTALVASVLSGFDPGVFDIIVLEGNSYTRKAPFAAWGDVVSGLFTPADVDYNEVSIIDLTSDDDWWPLIADVFGIEPLVMDTFVNIDPETKRDIAVNLVVKRITERAVEKPLIIVTENAQWMDESSLELVRLLTDVSDDVPLAVIVVARDEEPLLCGVTIEVDPLTDNIARKILVGGAPSLSEKPGYVEKAVGLAAGNAYYLCELAKSARTAEVNIEELKIPLSVRGMIQARLDNLGGTAPVLVKKASVLGQTVEGELLREVAGLTENEFDEALGRLYREGVLELEKDRLRFVNALDQEIALGMVVRKEQVAVNLAAAEALSVMEGLQTPERSSRIAQYYIDAGEKERAVAHLRRAGSAAYRAFDVDAAKYFFEQARTICIEEKLTNVQAEITLELVDVLRKRPEIERAISLLRNDVSLVTDDKGKGDYLTAQGALLIRLERLQEAETCLITAIEYYNRAKAYNESAHATLALARVEALTGRSDAALADIKKCQYIFDETGDKLGAADAHNVTGFVYCVNDNYDEAAPEFEESYKLWKETDKLDGVVMVLNNLAGIRSAQGDYDASIKILTDLVRFSKLTGDSYNEAISLMNLSGMYYSVGNLKESDSVYRDADNIIGRYRFDELKGPNLATGISIKIAQGRYDEASEMIEGFGRTSLAEARERYVWSVKIFELEVELKTVGLTGEELAKRAERLAPEFDKPNLRELNADLYPVITEGYIGLGMMGEAERALSSFIEFDKTDGVARDNVKGLLQAKLFYAKRDYDTAGKNAVAVFKEAKKKDDYRYMAESLGVLSRALYELEDERWEVYAPQAVKLFNRLGAEPLARELEEDLGLD
ncbi:MAG: tetratricopeptide repeat protein [Candidatus Coatesbacteria bacterium]|nr:MAG: tetratricopeptide repeat protein [Candidatus Coatesbacteria bacterium]